jgi:hypothetical protein
MLQELSLTAHTRHAVYKLVQRRVKKTILSFHILSVLLFFLNPTESTSVQKAIDYATNKNSPSVFVLPTSCLSFNCISNTEVMTEVRQIFLSGNISCEVE